MTTDPVADLLTRIRNANMAGLDTVEAPVSRLKANIARVLKDEGFIKNFRLVRADNKHFLRIYLKSEAGKKRSLVSAARVNPVFVAMLAPMTFRGF